MNPHAPAFPQPLTTDAEVNLIASYSVPDGGGMTVRQWFAAQALTNPAICTGSVPDWQINVWFGDEATLISRERIVARQAFALADAMIAEGNR